MRDIVIKKLIANSFLWLLDSGRFFEWSNHKKRCMKKRTVKFTIIIIIIIIIAFFVSGIGHCQQPVKKEVAQLEQQSDSIISRMEKMMRKVKNDDSENVKKIFLFFTERGVLALPDQNSFRFLGRRPQDGKYFVIAIVPDSSIGTIESMTSNPFHGVRFTQLFGSSTLVVCSSQKFSEPLQTLALYDQTYRAYIYIIPRPYDGDASDFVANEIEISHFEAVLMNTSIPNFKSQISVVARDIVSQTKKKKCVLGKDDSTYSALINSAVKKISISRNTENVFEMRFQNERVRMQIMFAVISLLSKDDTEREQKKQEVLFATYFLKTKII